ncbi:hypothetical protein [Streptomyces ehimensis]|uniref:Integrase n=1 Tax=Streptomyces ehimensis TaxID=68195 RepID=A0ABV9BF28_9ACTN
MTYFEKRTSTGGKTTWRVRYRYTDGTWGLESGFPTKKAAERWNEEDEAAMLNDADGDAPPA